MTTVLFTNYLISAVHLANFRAEMRGAGSEAELKRLADKHAPYWLSKDAAAARSDYADALRRVRGAA
jgi:hypothetical protein